MGHDSKVPSVMKRLMCDFYVNLSPKEAMRAKIADLPEGMDSHRHGRVHLQKVALFHVSLDLLIPFYAYYVYKLKTVTLARYLKSV